jgi:uncharacterized protein YacL
LLALSFTFTFYFISFLVAFLFAGKVFQGEFSFLNIPFAIITTCFLPSLTFKIFKKIENMIELKTEQGQQEKALFRGSHSKATNIMGKSKSTLNTASKVDPTGTAAAANTAAKGAGALSKYK